MKIETFKVHPSSLNIKIEELVTNGWSIVSTVDTSTKATPADSHGVGYGGDEITIIASNQKKVQ